MMNNDKTPPLTKQAMVEALTFDKPTLYPHQTKLFKQPDANDPSVWVEHEYAGGIATNITRPVNPELTAELEQYAKRRAYLEADARHETKERAIAIFGHHGKSLAVASALAAMVSATGRLSHSEPDIQYLDNPLIHGYDLGLSDDVAFNADWSDIEARINAYLDAPKLEPVMYQQFGRAKRIPMEEQTEAEAKTSYLMYNTQSPKGREGANNGKAAKALAKRRAANKVARKARRK